MLECLLFLVLATLVLSIGFCFCQSDGYEIVSYCWFNFLGSELEVPASAGRQDGAPHLYCYSLSFFLHISCLYLCLFSGWIIFFLIDLYELLIYFKIIFWIIYFTVISSQFFPHSLPPFFIFLSVKVLIYITVKVISLLPYSLSFWSLVEGILNPEFINTLNSLF